MTTRPAECPACGETEIIIDAPTQIIFSCGQIFELSRNGNQWKSAKTCDRAFDTAVSLGAALEDQHASTDALWNENTRLRAEVARLTDALDDQHAATDALHNERTQLQAQLAKMTEEVEGAYEVTDTLREQLATATAARDAALAQADAEWNARERYHAMMRDAQDALATERAARDAAEARKPKKVEFVFDERSLMMPDEHARMAGTMIVHREDFERIVSERIQREIEECSKQLAAARERGERVAALDPDKIEYYCLNTFFGGYHDNPDKMHAFQHGMRTVINVLRDALAPAALDAETDARESESKR